VAINMSDQVADISGIDGTVCVGTDRGREGVRVQGSLSLAPWEGLIVRGTLMEQR
jgi:hypothetical protein